MSIFNPWQSGTAALMALAITTGTTALLTTTPASAQLFPRQSTQIAIPTGTSIPVRYEQGKIVIAPKTMPLTLTVAASKP